MRNKNGAQDEGYIIIKFYLLPLSFSCILWFVITFPLRMSSLRVIVSLPFIPLRYVLSALLKQQKWNKSPFFLIRVKKLPFLKTQNQKSAYPTQRKCTENNNNNWERTQPKNRYTHKKEDLLLISHDTVIVSWFSYPITHLLSLNMIKSGIWRDPDFVVIAV